MSLRQIDTATKETDRFSDMFDGSASFSEDERKEILARINSLVSDRSGRAGQDGKKPAAAKRGVLLPLAVNIAGLLLVAGIYLVIQARYAGVQERLNLTGEGVSSAGEAIIEGIRAESEQKLEEKDIELEDTRRNLEEIEKQAETLRLTMDEQVKAREAELRASLDEELAAERKRLQNAGSPETEIRKRLAALEAEKSEQSAKDLAKLKAESEDALLKKEEELALAKQKADAAAERNTSSTSKLEELEGVRNREKLVSDRIGVWTRSIREYAAKGDFQSVRERSSELRTYLSSVAGQSAGLGALPAVQQRKDSELSLLDSLDSLIAELDAAQTVRRKAAVDPKQFAARGKEALSAGDTAAALAAYRSSLLAGAPDADTAEEAMEGYAKARELSLQAELGQATESAETARAELERKGGELASREEELRKLRREADGYQADSRKAQSRITELERSLAKSTSENRTQSRQIADLSSKLDGRDGTIRDLKASVASLQAAATDQKNIIAGLQGTVNERNSTVAGLQGIVNDRNTAIRSLQASVSAQKTTIDDQQSSLSGMGQKTSTLETQLRAAEKRASTLESQLADSELRAYERAKKDVQERVVSYFRGERLVSGTSKNPDDVFLVTLANAVAAWVPSSEGKAGDLSGASLAQAGLRLVGTVASVDGQTLSLEPIGTSSVKKGDEIRIRRKTPSGLEIVVASGTVTDVRQDLIRIRVTETLPGNSPLVMDPAYRVLRQ